MLLLQCPQHLGILDSQIAVWTFWQQGFVLVIEELSGAKGEYIFISNEAQLPTKLLGVVSQRLGHQLPTRCLKVQANVHCHSELGMRTPEHGADVMDLLDPQHPQSSIHLMTGMVP